MLNEDLRRQLGPSPLVYPLSDMAPHTKTHSQWGIDELNSEESNSVTRRATGDTTRPPQSSLFGGTGVTSVQTRMSAEKSDRFADRSEKRASTDSHSHSRRVDQNQYSTDGVQSASGLQAPSGVLSRNEMHTDHSSNRPGFGAEKRGRYIPPATRQRHSESASTAYAAHGEANWGQYRGNTGRESHSYHADPNAQCGLDQTLARLFKSTLSGTLRSPEDT